MLKRISRFFNKNQHHAGERFIAHSPQHSLSAEKISKNARSVVDVLQKKGFEAYVVGGSVRDLLLGLKPKDFDVATNAKPSEIKSLFKRSRIIGRRFQIVHVQFGRELIEVTTFRSNKNQDPKAKTDNNYRQQNDRGMLTRDNVFGSMRDDAHRRDLTINALYYNPSDNSIHDFTAGLNDIQGRTLRIIGDPATRFREDPVRLLRVIRFAAKLGFTIEPDTHNPMRKLAATLHHVSPPRLFDESLKLLMNGQALITFQLLCEYGLFDCLVPSASLMIKDKNSLANKLIEQAFTNTDSRIQSQKRVTPAFIYAALLWPRVQHIANHAISTEGVPASIAFNRAADEVIAKQISIIAIPRRFTLAMREIWALQLMLPRRGGNRAKRLSEHLRFRAAYDFVLLREQVGENLNGLGNWWTAYQDASEEKQTEMANAFKPPRKTRKRRRSKPANRKAD